MEWDVVLRVGPVKSMVFAILPISSITADTHAQTKAGNRQDVRKFVLTVWQTSRP